MKHDIVYLLRNDIAGEELRYSIRSVVQNFPYRKIIFVGGKPDGIEPDIYIEDIQEGKTKAQRSTHSLRKAIADNRLTDDIWLFNDDFFIMDKVKEDINYFNGTIEKRIVDIKRNIGASPYVHALDVMRGQLFNLKKDTLSFSLHLPFLFNRQKALDLFEKFPDLSMFRSFYANYYEIDCRYMKDVKVLDNETIPDTAYISTSDSSFREGKVGDFLRQYFAEPSEYEKSKETQLREQTKEIYDEDGNERYD